MKTELPLIIQGGMGIGVSSWRLARAVSLRGHLGVVSGTCIDSVFVRRLQDGDVDGDMRRAMEHFPLPAVAGHALQQHFRPAGRGGEPYKLLPMWQQRVSKARAEITMLAAFVEVYLAKEGHSGPVGINLLTKVQLPNLATLYGAMLAGVDYVLMGAGIPKEIPGALDAMAAGTRATLRFDVEHDTRGVIEEIPFDPADHFETPPQLGRPKFLPIIAAHSLAIMLARKSNGMVDGFVVEGPTAGGHNAPPRGRIEMDAHGEPIYGERDVVDLEEMRKLGKPFWLAGSTGHPAAVQNAVNAGAAGVQVGTLFAFSDESGIAQALKESVLERVRSGSIEISTDLRASPTGFPFKLVKLAYTNAYEETYAARERNCDLGYLRNAYRRPDGRIGYRCAAEPLRDWQNKGGTVEETERRRCLCNGLMANIDLAQERETGVEAPLLTAGDDLALMGGFLQGRASYSADDVIDYLLASVSPS